MTCANQTQLSSGRHEVQGLKCRQTREASIAALCLVGWVPHIAVGATRCDALVALVLISAVSILTLKFWQELVPCHLLQESRDRSHMYALTHSIPPESQKSALESC